MTCSLTALATVLAACGSSGTKTASSPTTSGAAPTQSTQSTQSTVASGAASGGASGGASGASLDLASVCPNPIKILTDWTPEIEQGAYYELAGSNGDIDKNNKDYTAPLVDPATGNPTNVKVQIVAGGPAVGNQSTPELLTEHPEYLMGADDLDTAIVDSQTTPVVGIVAPFDNSLHIFFWNPSKDHFTSVKDIGQSNATVLYFKGTSFVEYLAAAGYLNPKQLDGSYQGNPSRFVASGGGVVPQGFATSEPVIYTHELPAWNKPVSYILTSTTGYNPYSEMGEATPTNVKKYSACFKKLVPLIQRAQIAYIMNPDRTNNLIVNLDKAYGNLGGPYDLPVAEYGVKTLLADKIVDQPANGAFGSFDPARVSSLIDSIQPVISKAGGKQLPSGFSMKDVATNEFIDNSVKFTGYSGPYNNVSGVITEQGASK